MSASVPFLTLMNQLTFLLCMALTCVSLPLKAAESYLVMEAHSGKVLLASNSEQKRPVASLTKIATAKVVLDWAKVSRSSLSGLAVVPQGALSFGGPNPLQLQPGDQISLRDAIYSSLLGSDNIAAYTLADHVGRAILAQRRRGGDPQKAFVAEMNHLARALGMRRTKFVTPHGFTGGYSTAADIARLSVYAMRDDGFGFYVKQKSRTITIIRAGGGGRQSFAVRNANSLLGTSGINGIKTGYTPSAGQCIALNSHRSPVVQKMAGSGTTIRKRDLIVVLLNSQDSIGQARQLIAQAWPMYDQWAAAGYPLARKGKELILVPKIK